MKKISLKATVFLSVFVISLLLLLPGGAGFAEEPEIRVTINGMIANIADVGEYISDQTFLKLYPCETTGKMNVHQDEKGALVPVPGQKEQIFYLDGWNRLIPSSTLPGIGMPIFDTFKFFKVRDLAPGGCYKICVMMLDPPYPGMISLTAGDGRPFEMILPAPGPGESGHKIVVDLAAEPLTIPKPPKR